MDFRPTLAMPVAMAKNAPESLLRQPPAEIAERLYVAGADITPGGSVRVEDVARRAQIPRATLYYYFPGREALMDWLTLEALRRNAPVVAAARAEPLEGRVGSLLKALARVLAEQPAMTVRLMAALSANRASEPLVLEADRRLIAPLRRTLREAQTAGVLRLRLRESEVALAAFSAIATVIVVRVHAGETADLPLTAFRLAEQLADGLRAPA